MAFGKKACRIEREPEQLLAEFIDDLISQANTDFEETVNRVLAKNRELYRRLG
ncbi:DNA-binding protein [Thiocapsa roseopersicina]|nr:DNA-binding protein [Thiocapsa roseopersicina]